jgi:predicted enzyme related to lactoylglutathione lyase
MTPSMRTVIYPVRDLGAARSLYATLLGVEPYVDEPYYVGFRVADLEIGLDPSGHDKGIPGPVCYWHVDDIHKTLDNLIARGAEVQGKVTNVGGGRLITRVVDRDGNTVGLLQDPPAEETK